MMQMEIKKTNKQWYPYEEYGNYFKLEKGTLLWCAMNTDGTRDNNPSEVDWERGVERADQQRMQEIVYELEGKE